MHKRSIASEQCTQYNVKLYSYQLTINVGPVFFFISIQSIHFGVRQQLVDHIDQTGPYHKISSISFSYVPLENEILFIRTVLCLLHLFIPDLCILCYSTIVYDVFFSFFSVFFFLPKCGMYIYASYNN